MVFVARGGRNRDADLWTINTDGTDLQRLTDTRESEELPRFTLDGSAVIFIRSREGSAARELVRIDLATKHEARILRRELSVRKAIPLANGELLVQCGCRIDNGRLAPRAGFQEVFRVAGDGSAARPFISEQTVRDAVGGTDMLEIFNLVSAQTISRYILRVHSTPPRKPGDLITFTFESNYMTDDSGRLQSLGDFPRVSEFFPSATNSTFDLSPDGTRLIVFVRIPQGKPEEMWVLDLTQQRWKQLTYNLRH